MDDLVKYRIESAKERLESSKLLLEAGQYKDSIGRSYYAIFSAVRAVLAKDKIDFKKHSAVISYFQKEYIKTNVFDVGAVHFGPLTYQVWGRNQDFNAAHPERRYVMQIKWSSIEDDLKKIRETSK